MSATTKATVTTPTGIRLPTWGLSHGSRSHPSRDGVTTAPPTQRPWPTSRPSTRGRCHHHRQRGHSPISVAVATGRDRCPRAGRALPLRHQRAAGPREPPATTASTCGQVWSRTLSHLQLRRHHCPTLGVDAPCGGPSACGVGPGTTTCAALGPAAPRGGAVSASSRARQCTVWHVLQRHTLAAGAVERVDRSACCSRDAAHLELAGIAGKHAGRPPPTHAGRRAHARQHRPQRQCAPAAAQQSAVTADVGTAGRVEAPLTTGTAQQRCRRCRCRCRCRARSRGV